MKQTAKARFFLIISMVLVGVGIFSVAMLVADPAAAQLDRALQNLDDAVGSGSDTGLEGDLSTTIATIVKTALSMVGTIFLLLTVYAGLLWMTARGKEEQVEKAKEILRATIIGLFITMSAYAITYFIGSRLG